MSTGHFNTEHQTQKCPLYIHITHMSEVPSLQHFWVYIQMVSTEHQLSEVNNFYLFISECTNYNLSPNQQYQSTED